jgi:uncharacterized RDD family membrane protein YckC
MQNLLNEFEEPIYTYVGFWPRFWALLLDGLILGSATLLFNLIFSDIASPVIVILTSLLPFLYNPIMEYRYGATVGKMTMKIKIVNYNHQRLTLNNVIFRNFIYFATQLMSVFIELYNLYNIPENNIGSFKIRLDAFTPQQTTDLFFSLFVVFIYIVELIFLLNDTKYRSLHDRIGKTYVVKT